MSLARLAQLAQLARLAQLTLPLGFASVLATLSGAACGPAPNSLDGSVKTSHDLTFDSEELRFFPDQKAYEMQYKKSIDPNDPTKVDIVTKLDFNEPAGGIVKDKKIDLLDPKIAGAVTRVTAAGDTFPTTIKTGQVVFHSPATVGQVVDGEFAVTFDNGETLFGTWQTKLTSVSF